MRPRIPTAPSRSISVSLAASGGWAGMPSLTLPGTSRRFRGNIVEPPMGDADRRADRDLVRRFRDGDREAFLGLYRAHSPSVFRYALHMTGDRIRAEEITQDVFVWLIHHAGEWDEARGDLGAFLGGVARKLLLRQQRDDRR